MARLLLVLLVAVPALGAESLRWEGWSDAVFERAKKEKRLVLLDLEAVWCHWCHVMDKTTYRDPRVVELLSRRYVAVKVDQDARPDLANRYEDYGWPATVIFAPDGRELARRRGYLSPDEMASMLAAFADDPTPGPSVRPEAPPLAGGGVLTAAQRRELEAAHIQHYDEDEGGWGSGHKYVDWQSVEYSLRRARGGDARAGRMARQTLTAGLALLDPVWGGAYQYSTGGVWSEPHFEKLIQFQAELLRIYALASRELGEPAYLDAARAIRRYVRTFLTSPEGAFYTSQDADVVPGRHAADYFARDDAGRRALGLPRVDTHVYARENGWVIQALAALHMVTGDPQALEDAVRAAEWIVAKRSLSGGGFSHGDRDAGGPFLGDTLAMGQAFLALSEATGDVRWLARAEAAAQFVDRTFRMPGGGYLSAKTRPGAAAVAAGAAAVAAGAAPPRPQRDENVAVARFAAALSRRTAQPRYRSTAREAMRHLSSPAVARRLPAAPVLLADLESSERPSSAPSRSGRPR